MSRPRIYLAGYLPRQAERILAACRHPKRVKVIPQESQCKQAHFRSAHEAHLVVGRWAPHKVCERAESHGAKVHFVSRIKDAPKVINNLTG